MHRFIFGPNLCVKMLGLLFQRACRIQALPVGFSVRIYSPKNENERAVEARRSFLEGCVTGRASFTENCVCCKFTRERHKYCLVGAKRSFSEVSNMCVSALRSTVFFQMSVSPGPNRNAKSDKFANTHLASVKRTSGNRRS